MRQSRRLSMMKALVVLAVLTAVVAGTVGTRQLGAVAGRSTISSSVAYKDVGPFEGTVYQGPDKGLSLTGLLKLRATKDGALIGLLVPKHGPAVMITGQLNGAAINLVFYLGKGKHVFGAGTLAHDPGTMSLVIGGPLVGPSDGDSGAWDIISSLKQAASDFYQGFKDGLTYILGG